MTENCGADTSDSLGLDITSSSSANAYGAYGALNAATSFDYTGIWLTMGNYPTSNNTPYYKLAVGASSSEVTLIEHLWCHTYRSGSRVYIPIRIPAGSRLSVAVQDDDAVARAYNVSGIGCHDPYTAGFTFTEAIGAVTASTTGTVITADASTAHTKGAYAQLIASTAHPIRMLGVGLAAPGNSINAADMLFDIAVGAASSEVVIVPDIQFSVNGVEAYIHQLFWYPVDIPAGTRISARVQSDVLSEAQTQMVCYGMR